MSNCDLNRHKKSDKIKWIITSIAFVLVFVFLAGLCMQLFAKDEKYKPSEWFKKPDTEQTQPDTGNNNLEKTQSSIRLANSNNATLRNSAYTSLGVPVPSSELARLETAFGGLEEYTGSSVSQSIYAKTVVSNNINNTTMTGILALKGVNIPFSTMPFILVPTSNVFADLSNFGYVNVTVTGSKGEIEPNTGTYGSSEYVPSGFNLYWVGGANGSYGSSYSVSYELVEIRKPIPLPDDPVKEGHTFLGWYFGTASDHGDNCARYDGSPIYSDTALHAHFQINRYTVTFNSDGGSSVSNQTVDWGTPATLPTPTRDGYAFKGWFLPNGTQYTNQAIKSNTSLTARWERNRFTITFNSDGGSAVENKAVMLNNSIPLTTPTKEGYNFKGWFMSDGTQYTNQPVTDDMTLTARWEIKTFTVTFYVDGEVYDTKTVEYGSQLVQVADEANVYSQNIVSFEYLNEIIPETEAAKMLVVDDMKVYATKATDTDKLVGTVKNNKWHIIGGVVGGVALIAVIAGIVSGTKRKRR